jgi:hypothetical protein
MTTGGHAIHILLDTVADACLIVAVVFIGAFVTEYAWHAYRVRRKSR